MKGQYTKLNQQQHFEKVKITEDWYIQNILNFIQEAKESLPLELSKMITLQCFEPTNKKPQIGCLRILPKILKL